MKRTGSNISSVLTIVIASSTFLALPSATWAQAFQDHLVQTPGLEDPSRGSVAGSLSELSIGPGQVARGAFSLPLPIELPAERGGILVKVLPSYSPEGGLSEWGMGFSANLSIRRQRLTGDIDYATDDFASPWGRLIQAEDGYYYPMGYSGRVRLRFADNTWTAWTPDGTTHEFRERLDTASGTYAWYLSSARSVVGERTELVYQRNDSGRPFLGTVYWGGREKQRHYKAVFDYEDLSAPFVSYRSGQALLLDRRVVGVRVFLRRLAQSGFFGFHWDELRWSYQLTYQPSPVGPAFYLSSLTRTFASGQAEPPVTYTYDFGDQTLATAIFGDLPGLDVYLAATNSSALEPNQAAILDVERDGLLDLEHSEELLLARQTPTGFSLEPLAAEPDAHPYCRPTPSPMNLPRVLARMKPGAAQPQVFGARYNFSSGDTEIALCHREGDLLYNQPPVLLPGAWELGANTRLVDLNRDRRPDLIQILPGAYRVAENTTDEGSYAFQIHPAGSLEPYFSPDASWIRDINGDGILDIVARYSSGLAVWFGKGDLQFEQQAVMMRPKLQGGQYLPGFESYGCWFVDANKDGLTDLLLTQNAYAYLFFNQGDEFREYPVPALAGVSWDMSNPTVADLDGDGNLDVTYTTAGGAVGLNLTSASTGLLVAADDGKGTVARFDYARAPAEEGIGYRGSLLSALTLESTGLDDLVVSYDYAQPVRHSEAQVLIGYQEVTRLSPSLADVRTFFHDDDIAGVELSRVESDAATPTLRRFSRTDYEERSYAGVRWLRPRTKTKGWERVSDGLVLEDRTSYLAFDGEFCPAQIEQSNAHGVLTTSMRISSPGGLANAIHCIPESVSLSGAHSEPDLDFAETIRMARNSAGLPTQVVQLGGGEKLTLQDITYDDFNRVTAVSVPGLGTTRLAYDEASELLLSVTSPDGVITKVGERDPLTDAIKDLDTLRGRFGSLQKAFRFDGFERLEKRWQDFGGSSEQQPLEQLAYSYATQAYLASITSRTLVDAVAGSTGLSAELLAADGGRVASLRSIPQGWAAGDLTARSRALLTDYAYERDALTAVGPDSFDLDTLFGGSWETGRVGKAGFGHEVESGRVVQQGVMQSVSTALSLEPGSLTSTREENGAYITRRGRDAEGRLLWQEDEEHNWTDYDYDALGRLVALALPGGARPTIAYDAFGRPATVERDGVGSITYTYQKGTGLLSGKYVRGAGGQLERSVAFAYDAAGRISSERHTSWQTGQRKTVSYVYDGLTDPPVVGQLGRLSEVRVGDGYKRADVFNPDGSLASRVFSIPGWMEVGLDYTYFAGGQLATETRTVTDLVSAQPVEQVTKEYSYDDWGRLDSLSLDGATLLSLSYDTQGRVEQVDLGQGRVIAHTYDPVTHELSGFWEDDGAWNAGVDWQLDDRGNVSQEIYAFADQVHTMDYGYGARGFLEAAGDSSSKAAYSYHPDGTPALIEDAAGSRTLERDGDVLRVGSSTYQCDALGRVIGRVGLQLSYGPDGHLGSAGDGSTEWTFLYDEAGNRVAKLENGTPVAGYLAGGYLAGGEFIEPVRVDGRVVGVIQAGAFRLLATDRRGTLLADPGGPANLPSPYGLRSSHPVLAEALDYVQKGYDADLGLVRMGLRDYDPFISQFLTPDPLYLESIDKCLGNPLECNLYGYARNNPLKFVDPDGTEGEELTQEEALEAARNAPPQTVREWKESQRSEVREPSIGAAPERRERLIHPSPLSVKKTDAFVVLGIGQNLEVLGAGEGGKVRLELRDDRTRVRAKGTAGAVGGELILDQMKDGGGRVQGRASAGPVELGSGVDISKDGEVTPNGRAVFKIIDVSAGALAEFGLKVSLVGKAKRSGPDSFLRVDLTLGVINLRGDFDWQGYDHEY